MNLRQIEVFRAVMNTGTTLNAAKLLHVSQPGISRMIRHIELNLGVTLFERSKGRLLPTPEARTLHTEIDRVYRGVQHIQHIAQHLRFGQNATLRVLASANTGLQLVPQTIAALQSRYPQSSVLFESLPTREIARLLVTEEADVAISSAPLDHPALAVREIGQWTLMCAVPAGHRLQGVKSLTPAQILDERLITYSAEAPQSAVIDRWLHRQAMARDVVVEVRSGYAACSLVAVGVGIAFVDDLSARAHRQEGIALVPLARAPRFPIYSVRNLNRPLSQAGKTFLNLAREQLLAIQAPSVL